MSQLQQLKDYIKLKGVATYDEVVKKAEEINHTWRSETWRRGLRNSKEIEAVGKNGGIPNEHNPIVEYKYLNSQEWHWVSEKPLPVINYQKLNL
jgi:hypothetical protein